HAPANPLVEAAGAEPVLPGGQRDTAPPSPNSEHGHPNEQDDPPVPRQENQPSLLYGPQRRPGGGARDHASRRESYRLDAVDESPDWEHDRRGRRDLRLLDALADRGATPDLENWCLSRRGHATTLCPGGHQVGDYPDRRGSPNRAHQ